jgi:excisionase family DNA binding protein
MSERIQMQGESQMQVENRERGYATVKAAAAYLAISVAKLYQMMAAGELAYVKLGKSRRIAWTALEQLIQRCTVSPAGWEPPQN